LAGDVGLGPRLTAYLATVHRDNTASLRLFEAAGYLPDRPVDDAGFTRFYKSAQ
jgi:hypothetical protein